MLTQKLPCRLTQLERLELSRELAALVRQKAKTEADKAEALADFRELLKDIAGATEEVARQLNNGKVERDVEVEWKYDWQGGRKVLFRLDTHEMIDDQPLTDDERQGQLFVINGGADEEQVG